MAQIMSNFTQLQIFKNLWFNSYSTIPKLSEELSIDRSNISRNLRRLLKFNLISRGTEKEKTEKVGRKASIIQINEDGGYFIGVAITENSCTAFLTNFRLNIIQENVVEENITVDNLVNILIKAIRPFRSYFEKVICMAIAFPGEVNAEGETPFFSKPLGLNESKKLNRIFQEKFQFPVYLENDANAGAMYHFFLNRHDHPSNLVYSLLAIHFNSDKVMGYLGNGIIINKQLYEGSNLFAGISGEMFRILSASNKVYDLNSLKKQLKQITSIENELNNFINELSNVISNIINLYDPSVYILGGYIEIFPEKIQKKLIEEVKEKIVNFQARKHEIYVDKSLMKSTAIGSCFSLINKFFNNLDVANKYLSKIV